MDIQEDGIQVEQRVLIVKGPPPIPDLVRFTVSIEQGTASKYITIDCSKLLLLGERYMQIKMPFAIFVDTNRRLQALLIPRS